MRKALAVGRKEFRQIARDRLSLLILMFIPAFFLLLYGYALNFDVQHIRLAVNKSGHHLFQLVAVHLSMANNDSSVRHKSA